MKTKIQTLVFLLVVVMTNCTKAQQTTNRQLKDIPKGAKTAVVTTAYQAIEHNGKWICGENAYLEHLDVNTTYYDRYGHKIRVDYADLFGGGKEQYYYTPEGRLKKVVVKRNGFKDTLSYIYNSNNQLLEIKGHGYGEHLNVEPEKRHYNSKGELITITRERDEIVYEHSPAIKGLSVQTYRQYLGENKVLAEKTIEIINSEGQLERKIKTYFNKDEQEYQKIEIIYTYDEKKRLSQTRYESCGMLGTTVEINEYNKHGDLIYSKVVYSGEAYDYKNEYEYNQEGKWIKKLEWMRGGEKLILFKRIPFIFVREYIEL